MKSKTLARGAKRTATPKSKAADKKVAAAKAAKLPRSRRK
jgi:hypothetical protein